MSRSGIAASFEVKLVTGKKLIPVEVPDHFLISPQFKGQIDKKSFFLYGRMWLTHNEIAKLIHKHGGYVAELGPRDGVFAVLSDRAVLSAGEGDGIEFLVKKTPDSHRIGDWIKAKYQIITETQLRDALVGKWRDPGVVEFLGTTYPTAQVEQTRQSIATVVAALDDVIATKTGDEQT